MDNNYSNLHISDLALLLSATTRELVRISQIDGYCLTHKDRLARERLLTDMQSIRIEIKQRLELQKFTASMPVHYKKISFTHSTLQKLTAEAEITFSQKTAAG